MASSSLAPLPPLPPLSNIINTTKLTIDIIPPTPPALAPHETARYFPTTAPSSPTSPTPSASTTVCDHPRHDRPGVIRLDTGSTAVSKRRSSFIEAFSPPASPSSSHTSTATTNGTKDAAISTTAARGKGKEVESQGEATSGESESENERVVPVSCELERTTTDPSFDRFSLPDEEALRDAAECMLVGESGQAVSFGDLIQQRRKVVVVFLRHMWCGLCQQYVEAMQNATSSIAILPSQQNSPAHSVHSLPPHARLDSTTSSATSSPIDTPVVSSRTSQESTSSTSAKELQLTSKPPLYIILISSGSPNLIPIYRARLNCPFPLYAITPRSRALYTALGMSLRSLKGGPETEKGSYVRRSRVGNVVNSTLSGLSMLRYPGDQKQLGGEFVFESQKDGLKCIYASRMSNTRNHSEVRDLFAAAGVELSREDQHSVYGA